MSYLYLGGLWVGVQQQPKQPHVFRVLSLVTPFVPAAAATAAATADAASTASTGEAEDEGVQGEEIAVGAGADGVRLGLQEGSGQLPPPCQNTRVSKKVTR